MAAAPKGTPTTATGVKVAAKGGPQLQKWLKNPGLRYLLPTSALPKAQQQQRARALVAKTPIVDGSSITNADAQNQANAAVQTRYGDAERQAGANVQAMQQYQKQQGGYFDHYLQILDQSQQAIAANNARATGEVGALIGAAGQAGQGDANWVQAGANQDAAVRGAVPSQENMLRAQQAAGVRGMLTGSFGAQVATQGANANNAASVRQVAGAQQAVLGSKEAQGRVIKALEDKAAMKGQEGAYAQQFLDTLRANETKNVQTQIATDALNRSKQTAQKATDDYRNRQLALATAKAAGIDPLTGKPLPAKPLSPAEKRAQEIFNHEKAAGTGPFAPAKTAAAAKGKSPYLGTAGQNSAKDQVDGAVTVAKGLKAHYSQAKVRQILLNGLPAEHVTKDKDGKKLPTPVTLPAVKAVPKRWVNVVMDLVYLGHISPANVKALHAAGIKVNKLGYPTGPAPAKVKPAAKNPLSDGPAGFPTLKG